MLWGGKSQVGSCDTGHVCSPAVSTFRFRVVDVAKQLGGGCATPPSPQPILDGVTPVLDKLAGEERKPDCDDQRDDLRPRGCPCRSSRTAAKMAGSIARVIGARRAVRA